MVCLRDMVNKSRYAAEVLRNFGFDSVRLAVPDPTRYRDGLAYNTND